MLDLSAAFDTVNHEMLLDTMESRFGINGTVLDWFRSYLGGRKQRVIVHNTVSDAMNLNCGVPQGSCLGPVLFILYISSLYDIISQHLPNVHGYADDHQLYIWFKPEPVSEKESIKAMEMCVSDVRKWMLVNRLMINDSKTEVMLIGTIQQLSKVSVEGIRVGDETITPVSLVKNLGMYLDQNLKMDKHITKLCSKAFYQLYKLKRIRKFLSNDAIQSVVHAFITSNLDYCNSLMYGMPQHLIDRLQRVQNAAARVVLLIPKFDHIRKALFDLHWLPVKQRICFKIMLLTFKCLIGKAPVYLRDMVVKYVPQRTLRSSDALLLKVPRFKNKTLGARTFAYAAASLWNSLPIEVRATDNIESFKSILKTHLFKLAYDIS